MAPVFAELWPFIDKVLTEFVSLDEMCEATCRVVKHSLRVMGGQFEPYLRDFIKKAMFCYQKNPIGSFVYSVEFCFIDFCENEDFSLLFKEAFEFICSHTNSNVFK